MCAMKEMCTLPSVDVLGLIFVGKLLDGGLTHIPDWVEHEDFNSFNLL